MSMLHSEPPKLDYSKRFGEVDASRKDVANSVKKELNF